MIHSPVYDLASPFPLATRALMNRISLDACFDLKQRSETMKPRVTNRKKLGWLLAALAVLGMVGENFVGDSALQGVLTDIGAMIVLAIGLLMIAT